MNLRQRNELRQRLKLIYCPNGQNYLVKKKYK
jgi:hypothetical protein